MELTLLKKKKIAENTYEILFRPESKKFEFVPGQYIHLKIPLAYHDPRGNERDFSISSIPSDIYLSISIRESDSGFKKTLLSSIKKVQVSGPFGSFTLPKNTNQPLVFIAGGIGITPFISMIRHVTSQNLPYHITLIYVNKSHEYAAYLNDLVQLEKENHKFKLTQYNGHLNKNVIKDKISELKQSMFYISGLPGMVADTQELLTVLGVEARYIKTEEFSGYKYEFTGIPNGHNTSTPIGDMLIENTIPGEGIAGELAKRSLSDLEALLQALNNTAIVSEANTQGNITFVNDKFIEISKYSKEELIGQNHRILKSEQHTKAFYNNLWSTITRGKLWRGQIKNKAKDGSFYWVDTSIAPIIGNDHKPVKYISVRFPITERQQAEEELQARVRQQNVLTVLSQEALASQNLTELFDTTVNLLSQTMNVEYCTVLKLLPGGQHLIFESGLGFKSVVYGHTLVSTECDSSMAGYTLYTKEPVILEDITTESRFAGSALLHDNNINSGVSVIIHGQDMPFGILEMYTKKKRIFTQDDINFIQAVANLLANATRNQLDKRKDEFLGIASHELKTPLTSVKTYIQMLQSRAEKQKDEESIMFLSKTDNQLARVTELINDLLDISRINSGKLEFHNELFSLKNLIKEIVSEHLLLFNKHKIVFENNATEKIYGDKFRIGQVIMNLITNADKYSPDADKIIIRTKSDTGKVIISVQDFGVGVADSDQPHIFDRFYQGNGKKKDNFPGGLGLGLYISSEIVKRHHGNIWVESKEGKGSIFQFTLPIKK